MSGPDEVLERWCDGKGAIIGVAGGLCTIPLFALSLLADTTVRTERLFLPLVFGLVFGISGAGIGAVAGACIGEYRLHSRLRRGFLGAIVMGSFGALMTYLEFDMYFNFGNVERLSPLIVVQDLIIPVLAGFAGGVMVGMMNERR